MATNKAYSNLQEREALIVEHWPRTVFAAQYLAHRLPEWVCFEDAVAEAGIGLIQSIDSYQKDRKGGANLKTWTWKRMTGAILDLIRRETGRKGASRVFLRGQEAETAFKEIVCRIDGPDASAASEESAQMKLLGIMMRRKLNEREYFVISRLLKGRPAREIALEMQCHESYCSQIKMNAVRKLRRAA